ncbi:MAG: alpha/beta hydrolase family protein [Acidimicrobiales bacterium]
MARLRLAYGKRHSQHGDLWLPDQPAPAGGWPVVVLLHGGFWRAVYGLGLMRDLAEDLTKRGWAAWNLEYRRVGTVPPGGWPGTFEDVGGGIDYLRELAAAHALDLGRTVVVGHSAGGHLALWSAGRWKMPPHAPGASRKEGPLKLRGAVGLAPVCNLAEAWRQGLGGGAVGRLLGGGPDRYPERYAATDPAALLPLNVPQVLVHGAVDAAVPLSLSQGYVERAAAAGDPVTLIELADVAHMELIDPSSEAWAATVVHLERLLAV